MTREEAARWLTNFFLPPMTNQWGESLRKESADKFYQALLDLTAPIAGPSIDGSGGGHSPDDRERKLTFALPTTATAAPDLPTICACGHPERSGIRHSIQWCQRPAPTGIDAITGACVSAASLPPTFIGAEPNPPAPTVSERVREAIDAFEIAVRCWHVGDTHGDAVKRANAARRALEAAIAEERQEATGYNAQFWREMQADRDRLQRELNAARRENGNLRIRLELAEREAGKP